MKEFFQTLQKKRQERGVSLDDIHRKTRLPMPYLNAIENGNIQDLPDGYERLYLKRYIQEIGQDTDAILRDFDMLSGRLSIPETEDVPATEEMVPETSEPPINLDAAHKYFWIAFAAIATIAAIYFIYNYYAFEETIQRRDIVEIPITQLVEPEPPPANATQTTDSLATESMQTENPAPQTFVAPMDTIRILIRALERTWIREISDQNDTTEYILSSGTSRSIKAYSQVALRLGRADGVAVTVNNQTKAGFGAPNQVADLLITKEGISRQRILNVRNNPERQTPIDPDAAGE